MKRKAGDLGQSSLIWFVKKAKMDVQLSEKRRLALLVACGEHVLPLTFFESNFTKEMLKLSAAVRSEDIRAEIILWHKKWRKNCEQN